MLTGGTATVKQTEAGLEISVPAAARDSLDTIVKLELDAPAKDIQLSFPPVTGQRVRLNLLKTTDGPSIWEFRLEAK